MEILQTVPDELFSDSFVAEALGLEDDADCDASQTDVTVGSRPCHVGNLS